MEIKKLKQENIFLVLFDYGSGSKGKTFLEYNVVTLI